MFFDMSTDFGAVFLKFYFLLFLVQFQYYQGNKQNYSTGKPNRFVHLHLIFQMIIGTNLTFLRSNYDFFSRQCKELPKFGCHLLADYENEAAYQVLRNS